MGIIKHILIANELASYRQSIAEVFRFSLPGLDVFEAESASLNREVVRVRPELVICSRITPLVEERVPNWVELYPDYEPHSTFCLDGKISEVYQVELSDLLAVVDGASPAT